MSKTEKLEKLSKAADHLRKAVQLLREIEEDRSNNSFLCFDAFSFRGDVKDILTTDRGKAGLDALISKVYRELAQEVK